MAIPVTQLHILRLLLQCDVNLSGVQRDMRSNAATWNAAAQTQAQPVATIAQWMNDAALAYGKRLGWVDSLLADTTTWPKVSALWALLGGSSADFTNITTPLHSVVDQIGPASKASYADLIAVCTTITSSVDAPLSLWPE
jgi:hypothetical protein